MPLTRTTVQGLDEIRELNRLFLIFLRKHEEIGRAALGLPPAAARVLAAAPPKLVDALADFPQAMFRLRLDGLGRRSVLDPARGALGAAQRSLQLTLLVSAWNLSRQSDYAARLFLRLGDDEVRALRMTPLSELPVIALTSDLVRCAYRELGWMWRALLSAENPEQRRLLLLLALQPRVELNRQLGSARTLQASV